MKYRYNIVIALALVFLMLLVPLSGLVVAREGCICTQEDDGWYRKDWEAGPFPFIWNGTLLRTEGNIEFWELYTESRMMMAEPCPGDLDGGVEWVKMTLMWDPLLQIGQIIKFEHNGYNLMFTALDFTNGTIGGTSNPGYQFNVTGIGYGWYRCNCTWYNLIIKISFWGEYTNQTIPFLRGNSTAYELATLRFGHQQSVGGSLVPMDNMAVLSPYLVLLMLVAVVSLTAAFVVKRRLLH